MSVETPDIASLLSGISDGIRQLLSEVSALRERPAVSTVPRTYYSVKEAATMLGKSEYTVRQWANEGRVNAIKRVERRGGSAAWSIPAKEIERFRNDGLLPPDPQRNARN